MQQRIKNAVDRAGTTAVTSMQRSRYQPPSLLSTPACGKSETSLALGSLLLYLTNPHLPPEEARLGWQLVQRWLTEIVEVREKIVKLFTKPSLGEHSDG